MEFEVVTFIASYLSKGPHTVYDYILYDCENSRQKKCAVKVWQIKEVFICVLSSALQSLSKTIDMSFQWLSIVWTTVSDSRLILSFEIKRTWISSFTKLTQWIFLVSILQNGVGSFCVSSFNLKNPDNVFSVCSFLASWNVKMWGVISD